MTVTLIPIIHWLKLIVLLAQNVYQATKPQIAVAQRQSGKNIA